MIKISEKLKAFGSMAEAVKEMIEIAERLNSLEQAEAESLARMEKAKQDAEKYLERGKKAESQAFAFHSEKTNEAIQILDQAKKEAAVILADATTRGNDAIAAAEATAKELNEAADKNYVLSNVLEQQAKEKLKQLETEIVAKEKQLQELRTAIAAIVGK